MGLHTSPSNVVGELEALIPAFNDVSGNFETEKGVIMGDLNAGGRLGSSNQGPQAKHFSSCLVI